MSTLLSDLRHTARSLPTWVMPNALDSRPASAKRFLMTKAAHQASAKRSLLR